ncbi:MULTISPECIES: type II toxin-antitoxin system prevent-host-death family antitoxin, partial [unclassified Frankia]|uniref:type II toxin-antitoxin system prevent-host-death family antitoxin n=1 Tax=unclassified Frankia TaxID=2632575 RepID=UPI002AD3FF79
MRSEPLDAVRDRLDELADEVDQTGPIVLSRPGRTSVVVVSLDDWQRFEDLASEEETEWWRHVSAERAAAGEPPEDGED